VQRLASNLNTRDYQKQNNYKSTIIYLKIVNNPKFRVIIRQEQNHAHANRSNGKNLTDTNMQVDVDPEQKFDALRQPSCNAHDKGKWCTRQTSGVLGIPPGSYLALPPTIQWAPTITVLSSGSVSGVEMVRRCLGALGGRRSGNEIGHLVYLGLCSFGGGSLSLATFQY
jgi:hypothetical protein